jgi:Fe-S oxidoreductase
MKVGLFIPCYVNAVYPEVGAATYKLLDYLGVEVVYPMEQTCCGQPMANAGFEDKAIPLANSSTASLKGMTMWWDHPPVVLLLFANIIRNYKKDRTYLSYRSYNLRYL